MDFAKIFKSKKAVSWHTLGAILNVFIEALKAHKDRTHALEQRLVTLETLAAESVERTKALETRPALKYGGAWKEDRGGCSEGTLLTHRGALWLAATPTSGAPGAPGATGWRLIVKSGGAI